MTNGPPKLPEGYRLDLSADPDAPALRRPDGTVVARFAVRGMTHEAVEREALEDLLGTSRKPGGPDSPNAFVESPSRRTSMRRHILSRPTWRPPRARAQRLCVLRAMLPFALLVSPLFGDSVHYEVLLSGL